MDSAVIGTEQRLKWNNYDNKKLNYQILNKDLISNIEYKIISAHYCGKNHNNYGVMLSNGSSINIDNDYVENASPEVSDPRESIIFQRANELIILDIKRNYLKKAEHLNTNLLRNTTESFINFHISVTLKDINTLEIVPNLVPFLLSRFYSGTGSISTFGISMFHVYDYISSETSNTCYPNNPLVHNNFDHLTLEPYRRIHITCNDPLMSDLSLYLTIGTTVMVLKMIEDGACIGVSYKLLNPLNTLKKLQYNYTWQSPVELASGDFASPLEINEYYLECAEKYISLKKVPEWMYICTRLWRDTIEKLRNNSKDIYQTLDNYIKLKLWMNGINEKGFSIETFNTYCYLISLFKDLIKNFSSNDEIYFKEYLKDNIPHVVFDLINERMLMQNLSFEDLLIAFKLYKNFIKINDWYYNIDESTGLFWKMRNEGTIISNMISLSEIEAAKNYPPKSTRAYPRGSAIRELKQKAVSNISAGWDNINYYQGNLDLKNPYKTDFKINFDMIKPAY